MIDLAKSFAGSLEQAGGPTCSVATDIFQVNKANKTQKSFKQQSFASASAFKKGDKRHYYIVYDDVHNTGSTMLNLIGYIEHHGGKVLLAAAEGFSDASRHRLEADRDWIKKKWGEKAASTVAQTLDDGRVEFPTEAENRWSRFALTAKKFGVDVRDLTPEERMGQIDMLIDADILYNRDKLSPEALGEKVSGDMGLITKRMEKLLAEYPEMGGVPLSEQDRLLLRQQALNGSDLSNSPSFGRR